MKEAYDKSTYQNLKPGDFLIARNLFSLRMVRYLKEKTIKSLSELVSAISFVWHMLVIREINRKF